MNNYIAGLEKIREGIDILLKELSESTIAVADSKVEESAPKTVNKTAETVTEAEDLNSMTYNELKKYAKQLGITAVGNRKEIIEKILNVQDSDDAKTEEEVSEQETVTAPPTKKVGKSAIKSKKIAEPVEEVEEEEDLEDDEDEEEVDQIEQQVLDAVEDLEDDEIREILEDAGVSSKGKRQSLIAKLVQAVRDGKIDFDDDDSEDITGTDTEEEDEDPINESNTKMTKKRKKAYEDFCKETKESFDDGEITRKDLIEFINDFNETKDKMKNVSDEELVDTYLEISANLIDDEGNIVEEGAYMINDIPYCCGKPLKYDEDEEVYICEVCGEEYSGEE